MKKTVTGTWKRATKPSHAASIGLIDQRPHCHRTTTRPQGIHAANDFVSLHAGVAAQAGERQKLERLCRYISKTRGIRETAVTSQPFGQMTTDKSGAADQFDRSLNRANELV
jgi:hypothetical protein